MIVVTLPTLEDGFANPEQAWSVALEVEAEGPIEQALRVVARDGRVLEVELELPVDIGEVNTAEHPAFLLHLLEERRARHWRVQHKLMEVGAMRNRIFDFLLNVFRRVVLEPDDGRTQQLDTVLAQLGGQRLGIGIP